MIRIKEPSSRSCKNPLVVAACIALAAVLGQAAEEPTAAQEPNPIANSGFETAAPDAATPAHWTGHAAVYARDDTAAHTGKASLRYTNDDPKRYLLCGQGVPAKPGHRYRFSVWVKTQDLAGSGGATICLEWTDKAGKWLSGSYPDGIKGTRNWTRVEGIADVPENAGSCTLTCYVRRGGTGTAWFDDVELQLADVKPPMMRTVLLTPLYRGRITVAGPKQIRLAAHLSLAANDMKADGVRLTAELLDAENKAVRRAEPPKELRDDQPIDLAMPVGDLPVGKYTAVVTLRGTGGNTLVETRDEIVRLADDFHAAAYIDEHRRLIVDGKPFFPIGTYWSRINEKELDLYADSKFNCLMPYSPPTAEQMDLAAKRGLKILYSLKDLYWRTRWCPKTIRRLADEEPLVRQTVRQFRDHPALLAWYLNDELVQPHLPRLEAHQRWVVEEDPQHPTWVVLGEAGITTVADFVRTFDVIGTDPYPIDRRSPSMAAEWTISTFQQVDRARPMWQVPQIFNHSSYEKNEKHRTPTAAEKRSMAWQCICEGATGLVFYSWFDIRKRLDVPFAEQWPDLKKMAAEIDAAAPALLSIEPAPAVTVVCTPAEPRWLHWLVRHHAGRTYLFAVNNGDAEGQATFTFERDIKSVSVPAESRSIQPEGRSFQERFGKLDVRIYELD